ncbi:hypothetical protein UCRPA7_1731 [Phaeoacremonium minimum UCRPA7]|uniref:Uncharacterized protein n=1 Tax=Phaeoacremonium minimum (strain UCR-PA7) TaxID=1286976 RepID=R8BTY6_PHAM7|nr:hypothetical protein UCRPA7_1731 [Phaeoacremonium minimum UCRPA7]EOO02759.1 hypothetical protein UCRPA7_1731 [Phaeoacremonium minimum UCRPA7]
MCMGATCAECSKKSWRGCGNHIPSAMSGVPEEEWCTCEPKVTVDGKEFPPAAKMSIPGASWLSNLIGGGQKQNTGKGDL